MHLQPIGIVLLFDVVIVVQHCQCTCFVFAEEYNLDTSSVQSIWPSNYEDLGVSGRSGHAAFMWTISNGTSYMVVFGGTAYDEEGYMNYLNDVQV